MKTIGLLGGTGWESTLEYYRIINEKISAATNNVHTAQIILFSVDFNDVRSRIDRSDYDSLGKFFTEKAIDIEKHGADCLLMCANTPHMFADAISQQINIPLIHIADATGEKIKQNNFCKVGLLGTRPTMEMPFYAQRLKESFRIDVITPPPAVRDYVHNTIYDEFTRGIFTADAKVRYLEIMQELRNAGAEGIIMGCTEIPLLIKQSDTDIQLFDTLQIHAEAAVAFALR